VFGNELYQAFDAVVRGLAVGEATTLEAAGGDWDPGLLFTVPADHPEIERLAGRYKNVGGLAEGLVVELANGARAVVVKVVEGGAVTLDANDMLAGRRREFTLELVGIEAGSGGGGGSGEEEEEEEGGDGA
jgi:FKBP-type peptidyl-prolyl cis-trans isomerase 2